ncbi:class I SAM-dependent methyltransferase [Synechococcus sp. BA-124 BA4]|uniref:class I SAM-dependent methyltransferase n=1 Tax=Synechococcus sp. BA-124 BA4 TaxID=3110251 RepID=UPI002B209654|nr:methyltransferase domain-containing protein [Synechococcus sp. BA-124 BA4]
MAKIKETIATYAAQSVEQRRGWFSPAAAAYAATRPRYPQQLVEAVVARAGLTATSTILEVGCGPGTATVSFAELGCGIVAIEPNPDFCLLAQEACQRFPNVEVVTTSLEEWKPHQEQFDAVVAASSFHWIPPEIANPKAARALRQNGWLILLWNKELQPPVQTHEALRTIYRRHAPELDRPYEDAATVAGILAVLGQPLLESPLYQGAHESRCVVESRLTIDDYLTLLTTYSPFLALDPAVREALLAELRQALERLHGESVPLTYTSGYLMAQRRKAGEAIEELHLQQ